MKCLAFGLVVLLALLAGGCAPVHGGAEDKPDEQALALKNSQIHIELIRQMLANGQYYAAAAHVEDERRASGPSDILTLLEAEARRHLGQRRQAETLYRQLLAGGEAAAAYHGLGLLYAEAGDLPSAVRSLGFAVQRAPTDVDYRNDLGYALMQSGRYHEAMPELSTAAELAPNQARNRNNLIELMMLMGNETAAARLAEESGTTPAGMKRLREDAQAIRSRLSAGSAKAAG